MTEDVKIRAVDEKGEAHDTVHGVPAREWFRVVNEVRREMETPEGLAALGLVRLYCEDPDCTRRCRSSTQMPGTYMLTRDQPPVQDMGEHDAHPTDSGTFLCASCARVAMAKRRIDARQS